VTNARRRTNGSWHVAHAPAGASCGRGWWSLTSGRISACPPDRRVADRKERGRLRIRAGSEDVSSPRRKRRGQRLETEVIAVQKAVSELTGKEFLLLDGSTLALSEFFPRTRRKPPSPRRASRSTSSFLADQNVDVVKVDIEDAEMSALQGWLARSPRTSAALTMFVEVHPVRRSRRQFRRGGFV
jgi:hypothetical protein